MQPQLENEDWHPELVETLTLLRKRPFTLSIEAIAEGAGVGASWLSQFARGKIEDPSINRTLKVRDFMRDFYAQAKVSE